MAMARRPLGKLDLGMFDRLRLGWRLLRDPRIPAWPKWLVPIVAALYVFSPIDALPDVLPLLGWTDDMGMIALALALVTMLTRWSPREIVDEHAADLGLFPELHRVTPERGTAAGSAKPKQEPIEAQYWVDDWR
jgi:uncharacterized membrane protein YkvA (DUF1232 family)